MTARPLVSVYTKDCAISAQVEMPDVFTAPIRDDIVQFCHMNMAKNKRQAHGVIMTQGHQHSAESWGTGRAVARIPRIGGSGTHRSGQAAFGNQCRKGRMFAPLRTWRKWHRKVNTNQKRHAVASALAASACAPLVLARGHDVNAVPELPLVVDSLNVDTTQALLKSLKAVGASASLAKSALKHHRCGAGKMRASRFTNARGPLIVYGDENNEVKRTAKNLPGVDTCNVHRLNLLQLAPGGHLGRFVIYTADAFKCLNKVFGTYRERGIEKSGYQLNRNCMSVMDLSRIINSDAVQAKLRAVRKTDCFAKTTKKNPLKNKSAMNRLNPYFVTEQAAKVKADAVRSTARKAALKAKHSKAGRKDKAVRVARHNQLHKDLESSFAAAHKVVEDEIKAGLLKNEESDEEESDE
jgi:large subunit ribosomal protein L4e